MTSYRDAGVDISAAGHLVESIAADVLATWNTRVTGPFGGFAAGVELPDGYEHPVLMLSTDGVGTKLDLARRSARWNGVGHDLVAMCVDDLAATGATPIGLVDYLAVGRIEPERDAAIVSSISRACAEASCPLLGGETAEHPGVMPPDGVDLAGTALGVVEKGSELGPHRVVPGDIVIGLHSPGLRSNGFSLVRSVMGDDVDAHIEVLLEPSVIYAPSVIRAAATGWVHSAAHITGGGLVTNLSRAVPEGLGARVDASTWETPEVFGLVASYGILPDEMYRTFNMGIGFCLVADRDHVDPVMEAAAGHHPVVLGTVDRTGHVNLG